MWSLMLSRTDAKCKPEKPTWAYSRTDQRIKVTLVGTELGAFKPFRASAYGTTACFFWRSSRHIHPEWSIQKHIYAISHSQLKNGPTEWFFLAEMSLFTCFPVGHLRKLAASVSSSLCFNEMFSRDRWAATSDAKSGAEIPLIRTPTKCFSCGCVEWRCRDRPSHCVPRVGVQANPFSLLCFHQVWSDLQSSGVWELMEKAKSQNVGVEHKSHACSLVLRLVNSITLCCVSVSTSLQAHLYTRISHPETF